MKKTLSLFLIICMLLPCFSFVSYAAASEVIIKSTDAEFINLNSWTLSTSPSVKGPNGEVGHYYSSGDKTVYFNATDKLSTTATNYGVYIWVHPYADATASAIDVVVRTDKYDKKYTIDTWGGSNSAVGRWEYIGNHTLTGGTNAMVSLARNSDLTSGTVRAMSVKFVPNDTTGAFSAYCKAADEYMISTVTHGAYAEKVFTGTNKWSASSIVGPYKDKSRYSNTSAENHYAIYSGAGLPNGNYGVYYYVDPASDDDLDYTDVAVKTGGTDNAKMFTIDTSNTNPDPRWVALGNYTVSATSKPAVVATKSHKSVSGKIIRNYGVKFVPNDKTAAELTADTVITVNSSDYLEKTNREGGSTNWQTSSLVDPFGDESRYTGHSEDYVEYNIPEITGSYGVYAYNIPHGTAVNKIDYRIMASGIENIVTVDGLHGGTGVRSWIYLGNYSFNGTATEKIIMERNENSSGGSLRGMGIRFVKNDTNSATPPYGIVQTTLTPGASSLYSTSGTWTATSMKGPLGTYIRSATDSSSTITYKANGFNGKYGVYAYIRSTSSSAQYINATVTASGTAKTVKIDATNCAGISTNKDREEWIYIGTYDFNKNANDKVVFKRNSSSGTIYVSEIKFIKDDPISARPGNVPIAQSKTLASGTHLIYDSDDWGFQKYGDWTISSIALTNANCYHTSQDEAYSIWYVDIGKVSGVEVFIPKIAPETSNVEDADTRFYVHAGSTTKEVSVDFTKGSAGWYSLGKYNFTGGGSEYIKVKKETAGGAYGNARAIGVKLSLNEEPFELEEESILAGTESLHVFERLGMYIPKTITTSYMDKEVTRAEMAVMLTRLFGKVDDITSEITSSKLNDASTHYSDTAEHSYRRTLAWVKIHPEFGIKKKGTNSFAPEQIATKTELLKFLLNQMGYYEDSDYKAKNLKSFASGLGIKVNSADKLTPRIMAQILYSAFEVPVNNDSGETFFEKLIRENGGVKDESLLTRKPFSSAMKAERTKAKNKDRNVIYNNDGNDVYHTYPEYPGDYPVSDYEKSSMSTTKFLAPRTSGLEDTVVNTVFYCTGVTNSYTHESTGETDTRKRDWSYLLKEYTGKDSLNTMIDAVRGMDKDIFWSMRMNDTHDYIYDVEYLDSWKQANQDKLFSTKEDSFYMAYGERRWTAIDYTYQESRQKIYNILEDTLSRYDVDGLELDFTRWPMYFIEVSQGKKAYPENVERMNNLMRMIRALTEKYSMERNKPILVSIYIPDCLDFCYDIGLDVRKWMDEDLFDMAVVGCHTGSFHPWETIIKEFNDHTDGNSLERMPVYAALDPLTYKSGLDEYYIDRHEAALAYKAGAKGVYTYNYFGINHERFDTLADLASCGTIDSDYVTQRKPSRGAYCVGSVDYVTLPQ